ncbi:hypothetical protein B566_EDAN014889 [Ephemera danica]|nr:hypothetical protein B566_EDAN014889 [Ephemera danica]
MRLSHIRVKMRLIIALLAGVVWLTASYGGTAAQQLCYNLNEPGTMEFYYTCNGKMIVPCTDKNTIDNTALQTDCTDVDSSQFGGGTATTNFCYPAQKRTSVCGTTPTCPSKGLFPISQGD